MSRTKQFKINDALDATMKLFQEKGYSGSSMSQIEEATGLKNQVFTMLSVQKKVCILPV